MRHLPDNLSKALRRADAGAALAVTLAGLWAYAPTLAALMRRWRDDPQYSHGFLVPLLALVVWWAHARRAPKSGEPARPNWWGLPLLLAGLGLRLAGARFYLDWFDGLSLLPVLAGLVLLGGGWPALRRCGPAVAMLAFMLPLPFQVEGALSARLQGVATAGSTYLLQALGLPAVAEGNVICIDDVRLGVLEACNGLGMLSAFFAISAAVALVVRRPWPDRLAVLLSAVPVAVLVNVLRITATGVVCGLRGSPAGQALVHDLAGWLMMPVALLAMWLELHLLARLFLDTRPIGPVPLALPEGSRRP
jgi:exosortase